MRQARTCDIRWTLAVALALGAAAPVATAVASPPSATNASPATAASADDAPTAAAQVPLPEGAFSLQLDDGAVWLTANAALQVSLLEALAEAAEFELQVGVLRPRRLTLRLERAPLSEALPALLGETPYGMDFSLDEVSGAHRVQRVRAGEVASAPMGASQDTLGTDASGSSSIDVEGDGDAEAASPLAREGRDAARSQERVLQKKLAQALQDRGVEADETLTVEDVEDLDVEGDALYDVIALATAASDPKIRSAAVERLGEESSYFALGTVLGALEDSDPRVILSAIEAVEESDDASLIPSLEALEDHSDRKIRRRAREAIEWLE